MQTPRDGLVGKKDIWTMGSGQTDCKTCPAVDTFKVIRQRQLLETILVFVLGTKLCGRIIVGNLASVLQDIVIFLLFCN